MLCDVSDMHRKSEDDDDICVEVGNMSALGNTAAEEVTLCWDSCVSLQFVSTLSYNCTHSHVFYRF